MLAFHDAANCARVTNRLFELEPAPLTLPNGMWTDTETWLVAELSSGPIIRASNKKAAGANLRKKRVRIDFLQKLIFRLVC